METNENKPTNSKQKTIVISVLLSVLIVFFVVLCVLTLTGALGGFENAVYNFLVGAKNPVLTGFVRVFTFAGFFPLLIGVGLVLELIPRTRHKFGFQAVLAAGVGYLINYIFKVIFQRPRPILNQIITATGFSFPSGHSAAAGAFFVTIIIYIIFNAKDRRISIPAIVLCTLMPIVVALSRVYLGVHYVTDTITGIVLGTIIAIIISLVLWALLNRKLTRFPKVHRLLFGKSYEIIPSAGQISHTIERLDDE